jgi:hypothetical protein
MARNSVGQPQRTQNNPLNLGTFSYTSLRYLKGSLGPQYKVVGRSDTSQYSNGGYGGGTYNHWFVIKLESPAWIIATKGPPRPQYIQVSAYDLNKIPIEGRSIFQEDSVPFGTKQNGEVYFPYLDAVMAAQSNLYNQFVQSRLDLGDQRYYPLSAGSYLICVSSTRNEPLAYEVGLVIEFPETQVLFELEDDDRSLVLQESGSEASGLSSPVLTNVTLPSNLYVATITPFVIDSTGSVEVPSTSILAIGEVVTNTAAFGILCDIGSEEYFNTVHDHSLFQWQTAWQAQHQETDRFPAVFVPLTNRP